MVHWWREGRRRKGNWRSEGCGGVRRVFWRRCLLRTSLTSVPLVADALLGVTQVTERQAFTLTCLALAAAVVGALAVVFTQWTHGQPNLNGESYRSVQVRRCALHTQRPRANPFTFVPPRVAGSPGIPG